MSLTAPYPVAFDVDYPDHPLNRLTTLLRPLVVLPVLLVLGLLLGTGTNMGRDTVAYGGGAIVVPTVLLLLFRHKYPRWWFDFNRELARFATRVGAYAVLLDDDYPSTDDPQHVHLDYDYPDVERDLNRWLPLVKWFLAIPHYIVLFFLSIAVFFVAIVAWFAILFTGRYPTGMFGFVEGVLRWHNRVAGYAFLLVTDRYPPLRLSA